MDTKPLADAITKALAYTENGGAPNLSNPSQGKTGEMKSIFQFTPDTWKKDSMEVFGKETPLTPDTETYVAHQKVSKWVKEGKTASQIASMWNAGVGEPDAYTGKFSDGSPSTGVNKKYNQPFNVPAYAKKVLNYSKQFYQEKQPQSAPTPSVSTVQSPVQSSKSPVNPLTPHPGLLSQVLKRRASKGMQMPKV
jgi:hypothetical protein